MSNDRPTSLTSLTDRPHDRSSTSTLASRSIESRTRRSNRISRARPVDAIAERSLARALDGRRERRTRARALGREWRLRRP